MVWGDMKNAIYIDLVGRYIQTQTAQRYALPRPPKNALVKNDGSRKPLNTGFWLPAPSVGRAGLGNANEYIFISLALRRQ